MGVDPSRVRELGRSPRMSRRTLLWAAAVAGAVGIGVVVRLIGIGLPPLSFHPARQLCDAMMAKGYWVHLGGVTPPGVRDAVLSGQPGFAEPPLIQGAAAVLYRVTGGEQLALVRALLALLWVAAVPAMWGLARRLLDRPSAYVACAVWLLLPFGVAASRSFQPDGPMAVGILLSAWALVRDDDLRTPRSRVLAVCLASATVFVKIVGVFFVAPVLVVLLRRRLGSRWWRSRRCWADGTVIVGPALLFVSAATASGAIQGGEEGRFFPRLLVSTSFWADWWHMAGRVVGPILVAVALAGLAMTGGRARSVLLALLGGYVAMGLVFSYHYSSHDYYHLPLIVPVALGAGAAASRVWDRARDRSTSLVSAAAFIVVVVLGGLVAARGQYPFVEASIPDRWQVLVDQAGAMGDALDHSSGVVVVAPVYGSIEQYWGEIAGPSWPRPGDLEVAELAGAPPLTPRERLDQMRSQQPLEWFLIADPLQYETDPELAHYLDSNFEVGARGDGWWAYRLD
jgi:4-amino-4-deoxy-L-arabinose transferase-like glycosyltransferase